MNSCRSELETSRTSHEHSQHYRYSPQRFYNLPRSRVSCFGSRSGLWNYVGATDRGAEARDCRCSVGTLSSVCTEHRELGSRAERASAREKARVPRTGRSTSARWKSPRRQKRSDAFLEDSSIQECELYGSNNYYTHAHTALTIIEPYFSARTFSRVQGSERVLQAGRRSRELLLDTQIEIFSRLQDLLEDHITTKQLPCISTRVCYQVVRPSHKYRYAVRRVDDDDDDDDEEEDEEDERRTRRRSEERRAREARAAAPQYTAQTQAHTDEASRWPSCEQFFCFEKNCDSMATIGKIDEEVIFCGCENHNHDSTHELQYETLKNEGAWSCTRNTRKSFPMTEEELRGPLRVPNIPADFFEFYRLLDTMRTRYYALQQQQQPLQQQHQQPLQPQQQQLQQQQIHHQQQQQQQQQQKQQQQQQQTSQLHPPSPYAPPLYPTYHLPSAVQDSYACHRVGRSSKGRQLVPSSRIRTKINSKIATILQITHIRPTVDPTPQKLCRKIPGSDRITISRSPRRGLTKLAIDGAQHSHDEVRSENHTHKRAPDAGAKAQLERMMAPEARTTLTR
ncbi:unnamed protein product [Trichogramma brassicae]|uniref:Uncharacterized protein n=1 Tax=Trichogramma brassicae TaxID=86971 RepID=A0A6H5IBZ5_9HYME|nr:unnamed protein product [Trichogramma brassicae]